MQRVAAWCLVLLLFQPALLFAQGYPAIIEGTITDSGHLPLASVTVILARTSDAVEHTTRTDDIGHFRFDAVTPGAYTLRTDVPGFGANARSLVVHVGGHYTVDIPLALTIADQVTVAAAAATVSLAATEGTLIRREEIAELPLNGRDYVSLLTLVPGVVSAVAGANPLNVNGTRPDHVAFSVDGTANNNRRGNEAVVTPPLDALEEVRITTSTGDVQLLGPASVTTALRSGGDRFTGSAFEFYRNGVLQASTPFTAAAQDLRRHEYGLTLGGPLGQQTTFFAALQGLSFNDSARRTSRVPTALERTGTFAASIRDPFTGRPFPGNTIPADRIDQLARAYLELYPAPTGTGTLNYSIDAGVSQGRWQPLAKLNHVVSGTTRVEARYLADVSHVTDPYRGSDLPAFGSGRTVHGQLAGLAHTWVPTSRLTIESQAGYTHQTLSEDVSDDAASPVVLPGVDPRYGPPNIAVAGLPAIGHPVFLPDQWRDRELSLASKATWTRQRHSLRAGAQYRRTEFASLFASYAGGQLAFQGAFTGNAFADFLLGLPTQTIRQIGTNRTHLTAGGFGLFVQDEWRLGHATTLTAGLAYSVEPPAVERDDHWGNFIPDRGGLVLAGGELGRRVVRTDWNDVAPRIQLAHRVGERGVVRVGYGRAYSHDLLFTQYQLLGASAYPFAQLEVFTPKAIGVPSLGTPFPASVTGTAPAASSPNGWDYDNPSPYQHVMQAAMSAVLGVAGVLDASYVGTRGRNQTVTVNLNQTQRLATGSTVPYPGFGRILYQTFEGRSQYDALQLGFTSPQGRSVSARVDLTWSRALDHASFGAPGRLPQDPGDIAAEWARSEFDRPVVFNATAIWRVPSLASSSRGRLGSLLRDWQVSGILRAASGTPFTPVVSSANQQAGFSIRPDLVGNPTIADPDAARWFDPSAFAVVPANAFRFGTAGRNSLRGPGQFTVDASLARMVTVGRTRIQARLDAFNVLNRVNLGLPDARIDQPTAGAITRAGAPRQVQLAARLSF